MNPLTCDIKTIQIPDAIIEDYRRIIGRFDRLSSWEETVRSKGDCQYANQWAADFFFRIITLRIKEISIREGIWDSVGKFLRHIYEVWTFPVPVKYYTVFNLYLTYLRKWTLKLPNLLNPENAAPHVKRYYEKRYCSEDSPEGDIPYDISTNASKVLGEVALFSVRKKYYHLRVKSITKSHFYILGFDRIEGDNVLAAKKVRFLNWNRETMYECSPADIGKLTRRVRLNIRLLNRNRLHPNVRYIYRSLYTIRFPDIQYDNVAYLEVNGNLWNIDSYLHYGGIVINSAKQSAAKMSSQVFNFVMGPPPKAPIPPTVSRKEDDDIPSPLSPINNLPSVTIHPMKVRRPRKRSIASNRDGNRRHIRPRNQ